MKPVRLVIQIPCLNEEKTLPATLKELPKQIEGVDEILVVVIDDGSTDGTAEIAKASGVDHVVRHLHNKGLAAAFRSGLEAAFQLDADIIVNTDADNQYPGEFIPALVAPILDGNADIVIGDRQTDRIAHFSPVKRLLQRLGSAVVRYVSGTKVPDAPSGFRALSREAAMRLNLITNYTYTLEMIIQAGKKNMTVGHIPITVNAQTRPSRLVRSNAGYVFRSVTAILHLFLLYEPIRSFLYISIPFWLVGVGLWLRYFILYLSGEVSRGSNVQSVVVGSVALIVAVFIDLIGLLGNILAVNRYLNEQILFTLKRLQFDAHIRMPQDNDKTK
ncbi:MAG: glycosyltransferase family 2 protein [Anaerolineae bacterium]|nr:glycosyltransferase family 2 protein [Anaerolineae bacterium]